MKNTIHNFCDERNIASHHIQQLYRRWLNQQKTKERKQLVQPVIDRFLTDGKKNEILTFCKAAPPEGLGKSHNEAMRIYKFYLKYKKGSVNALRPSPKTHHNESRFEETIEVWFKQAIIEWYKNGGERKAYYDAFWEKCQQAKLTGELPPEVEIPASSTFYYRLQKLPHVEIRGTQDPSKAKKRTLKGTYKDGMYPGAVIQMDHTPLDIYIIDEFTRQGWVRPWLTFAIDTFSHGIWGYFISMNPPSQESVMQCILNGITVKKSTEHWHHYEQYISTKGLDIDSQVFEWQTSGIPARIQADNSREFRANSVKKFCMKHSVTLSFRPVKRPDFGGFVERAQRTLNDAIRKAFRSEGAVYSPRTRMKPPSSKYDPKKAAKYTLEQLKQWVAFYIIYTYMRIPHAGELDTPNIMWQEALRGENYHPHRQIAGGALRLLNEKDEINLALYEARIDADCKISSEGLRCANIFYTSSWFDQARMQEVVKDGERIHFKISDWDRTRAWMRDPLTGKIQELIARKYKGDSRLETLILEYVELGIPLSKKLLVYARNYLRIGKTTKKTPSTEVNIFFENISEKIREKGQIDNRQKKIINDLLGTKSGQERLAVFLKTYSRGKGELEDLLQSGLLTSNEEERLELLLQSVDDDIEQPKEEEIDLSLFEVDVSKLKLQEREEEDLSLFEVDEEYLGILNSTQKQEEEFDLENYEPKLLPIAKYPRSNFPGGKKWKGTKIPKNNTKLIDD